MKHVVYIALISTKIYKCCIVTSYVTRQAIKVFTVPLEREEISALFLLNFCEFMISV